MQLSFVALVAIFVSSAMAREVLPGEHCGRKDTCPPGYGCHKIPGKPFIHRFGYCAKPKVPRTKSSLLPSPTPPSA
ncbi:hypothetical protein BASA61_002577 [Batrachochytrium salamandrivorans]|nr:hypothetical protein BASA62_002361 [Batrachochytrium salamandrivorans]KAH6599415.1 hypothetical protein BASA61_002577 [Batrachochytrium salamandrivorans]